MPKEKIRILYLSQYFPPEMGAPSARVYELSRRWVEDGANVTVLTGFPHHPTGIIPEEYQGYKFLKEKKNGINIVRTYVFAAPNQGFFKRIISYMSFMFSSIFQGTRRVGQQDVIIATSPQFFVGIAGYFISRLKKIPFVFEVRDLWPESIVQLGQLKNESIIRLLRWIEMKLYKNAIHITGVADSTMRILAERGIEKDKISIVKNGVDLDLFRNGNQREELKKQHNLQNKFVISYIGTHGLSHALDKVLETAEIMQDQKEVVFLLVGEGAEKQNLIKQAKRMQLENVMFLDQIGKNDLPCFYELSDVVLVTLKGLPLFKQVIPSKIFEIMGMSRPIVISVDGEAREIVEEAKAGLFAEPENVNDLKEKIEQLISNPDLREQMGQNGRKYVEENFDRNKLADDYLEILEKIASQSQSADSRAEVDSSGRKQPLAKVDSSGRERPREKVAKN
jgi:glycosyltransferase involved in cell wall biosynthesis